MSDQLDRLTAALADRYTIERELGTGGMATVYLAHDVRHDRKVALKVLRPELAAVIGAERFLAEIKTTANLQHPHILPLHDSGTVEGTVFYVMPFVDGESLRDRLNRERQLAVDDAVRIAAEVAGALDYAHRQNVIHRDIKPENILLHDGRALVADFGIALAAATTGGTRMTETGMSLGTPHYMSPEQAMGERDVDARTDVYALGCVLYEMLAGEPPFDGPTAQSIVAKVMSSEPEPVTTVRKTVPPHVAAAIGKALQKLPADRFRTAGELHAVLTGAHTIPTTSISTTGATARSPRTMAAVAAALLVGAVLGGVGMRLVSGDDPPAPVVRFPLTLPAGQQLLIQETDDVPVVLSPDGTRIVYVAIDSGAARPQLYLRRLDQTQPIPIAGTEDAVSPFFSPDGEWIGFVTAREDVLKKVPIGGGTPVTLADDVDNDFSSATWGDDGYIVYVNRDGGLNRVNAAGGVPESFQPWDAGPNLAQWPSALPGSGVLAGMCMQGCSQMQLVALDVGLDDPAPTAAACPVDYCAELVPNATRAVYLDPGYLVFYDRDDGVLGAPFDLARRRVTGPAVPLLESVLTGIAGGMRLSVSRSGAMVYLPGDAQRGVQLVEVDRSGRERVVTSEMRGFQHPRWSPSGDRIAVTLLEGQSSQIWIYDVASETLSQLTFEGGNQRPSWSPNGARIAFYGNRAGAWDLYWMPADGSGPPERVVDGEDTRNVSPVFWTHDGEWIVFDGLAGETRGSADQDVFAVRTEDDRSRQTAVSIPDSRQESGAVSPNGEWIAYGSRETGPWQVYVRPFMKPGGRWLISTGAASAPLWTSDDELVYRDDATQTMVAAKLEFGTTVRVVERTTLFDYRFYLDATVAPQYDVSRDGQRFLMLRRAAPTTAGTTPVVVLNWVEEVKARVGGN